MSAEITASVGRGGANQVNDVTVVQRLLAERGLRAGTPTGVCGADTQAAIDTFQGGFMRRPDGLIEPGGRSWRRLTRPPTPTTPPDGGLTRLVATPPHATLNPNLTAVSNALMTELFGNPRESYGVDCQAVTNPTLRRNMVHGQSVGPFRVSGLRPAVDSLRAVLADVHTLQPEAYQALGTAGMLCCRWVRGSTTSISNHSWGTAVDLTLNGVLDRRGNDMVQFGLTLIAPIFNQHGWYWGAAFRTEDAMHFEGSRTLVQTWQQQLT